MVKNLHFLFSIISIFTLENLAAQPIANAILTQNAIETGDTFNLRILVEGTPVAPETVDFSSWKTILPAENILHQSNWSFSGKKWAKDFTLISFDSATLKLPPLAVHLHLNDSVKTNPLELRVFPTPASTEISEMADLRDIRREPKNWMDYWIWIAAALVLAVLAFRFLRKKPVQKLQIAPAKPAEAQFSLLEITFQKLANLEKKGFLLNGKTGQAEEFCTELSMILREFLEKKYHIQALESTTKEILIFLKNTNFPENQTATLRELLQQTDFSKFSKMPPPPDFAEKSLRNTRNLVQKAAES